MKSFKLEVIADDSGEWASNDLHFATVGEAAAYGENLRSRWSAVRQTRVVQCSRDHPVNAVWNEEAAAQMRDTSEEPHIVEFGVVEALEPIDRLVQAMRDVSAFAAGDFASMSSFALEKLLQFVNCDEMREDAIKTGDLENWSRAVDELKTELERRGIKVKT